jgi:hypothetical protein
MGERVMTVSDVLGRAHGTRHPMPRPPGAGFRSTFAPPDVRPRGTGRNRRGRQVTIGAVNRRFAHVTRDDGDQVGMGRDPRGEAGATWSIAR